MRSSRSITWGSAALFVGAALLGLATAVAAQPSTTDLKLLQLQADQAAIASRAQGPRYALNEQPGSDPAQPINTPSKPRIVWSEPCPADQPTCERLAPPLPATAMGVRITNYFVGGNVDVFAAESLASPGVGLLLVDGKTYTLPTGGGVPKLTAIAGNLVSFVTNTNATGAFDLSVRTLTVTR